MSLNARTATAADFDSAAQSQANAFWVWAIIAGVTGYFAGWFAFIPGVIAILCIAKSMTATAVAGKLRVGTYTIPNPNNGVPDGDARNR